MTLQLLLTIAGMVAVTYGIRLSFLVFGHGLAFPPALQRALRYVPAAVLTALIVPMALAPQGPIALGAANAYLPGALATAVLAFYRQPTLLAIIVGFVVYGAWRWLW